ncbi:hypothetical protein LX32DRAFT_643213 [Colletotrichum zoysiae]|uniref:Uncharacterized protein n=1 Tax=Colletotrichum zoysiae TaxID=1216348 RepID=A0AAD9HBI5_9PEZI|nr:hypothetical protein LX32DRAFT_643213 [Colletotrichum zoysiae]
MSAEAPLPISPPHFLDGTRRDSLPPTLVCLAPSRPGLFYLHTLSAFERRRGTTTTTTSPSTYLPTDPCALAQRLHSAPGHRPVRFARLMSRGWTIGRLLISASSLLTNRALSLSSPLSPSPSFPLQPDGFSCSHIRRGGFSTPQHWVVKHGLVSRVRAQSIHPFWLIWPMLIQHVRKSYDDELKHSEPSWRCSPARLGT